MQNHNNIIITTTTTTNNNNNNIHSDNNSTNTNYNNDDNADIQVMPESKPPTIDFGDPDEENLVLTIAAASRSWGFFQAVNHGVPDEVISSLQEAGAGFFRLPQEEKDSYAKPPESHSIEGYGTKLRNCWGEFLFHKIWPQAQIDYRFWPNSPPTYRAANEEYSKHVKIVADKIFQCLSLGLGLEGHVLKDSIGGEKLEYMMKINYYPPGDSNGEDNSVKFGVHPHTDLSTITILVPNEVPGLQVTKGDEQWIDVDYIPNALIIHIGDQIEIASNGLYKSVLHRTVVDKEKTRMSWPVFLEPPPDFSVGPIPQLINDTNPPKYDTVMFKDYVHKKLNKPQ